MKKLQVKTTLVTVLASSRDECKISPSQARKAKIAYSALFFFMLMAWSAILIGEIKLCKSAK